MVLFRDQANIFPGVTRQVTVSATLFEGDVVFVLSMHTCERMETFFGQESACSCSRKVAFSMAEGHVGGKLLAESNQLVASQRRPLWSG